MATYYKWIWCLLNNSIVNSEWKCDVWVKGSECAIICLESNLYLVVWLSGLVKLKHWCNRNDWVNIQNNGRIWFLVGWKIWIRTVN